MVGYSLRSPVSVDIRYHIKDCVKRQQVSLHSAVFSCILTTLSQHFNLRLSKVLLVGLTVKNIELSPKQVVSTASRGEDR